MAVDYGRIHRLLRIVTLIQGSDGWTAAALAKECGITVRTIYRDLEMLEGAGIPYFFDETKKCYAIRRDFFMPPVQLTLDESLALVALGEHVGGSEQVPYTKGARKAVDKIRGVLPSKIRDEVARLTERVVIKLGATMPPEAAEDVYEVMREALAQKRMLRCCYESIGGAGNGKTFFFKPYHLLFNQRAWYVIGHHSGRNEVRCLKLNRFVDLKQTESTFTIPKTFSLAGHLGNAWRMIRGKKRFGVELDFDKEFAETVADTHWHPTQQIDWREDGGITFTCSVDGLEEIIWWILSMGPHCTVRKPPELAEQVRSLLQASLNAYNGVAPPA